MEGFEARLLELAGDVLTALGRGELGADAPVVRATAVALAELRRAPAGSEPATGSAAGSTASVAGSADAPTARGGRAAPPAVEQVLGVAARMRADRCSFASACALVAGELGTSAQAVRNACTRWLGVSAGEWQPLLIDGAEAGVLPLARRVAERCPWLVQRVAAGFGVSAAALAAPASAG